MKTAEQWKEINSEKTAKLLIYLYDRWQDEKKYEDINDYLQAIKRNVPNAYEITGDPFTFKVKCDNGILIVRISEDGESIEFHGEHITEKED